MSVSSTLVVDCCEVANSNSKPCDVSVCLVACVFKWVYAMQELTCVGQHHDKGRHADRECGLWLICKACVCVFVAKWSLSHTADCFILLVTCSVNASVARLFDLCVPVTVFWTWLGELFSQSWYIKVVFLAF